MKNTILLRLGLIIFLLGILYLQGASIFLIGFLAVFLGTVLLLRDRAWKGIGKFFDEKLPFTKTWPGWVKWGIVFVVFLGIYYVLKFVLYSALASLGFDVQGEMMRALNATG